MLILVFGTTYSQYPITKLIKGDSVVILTTKQGEKINELYVRYNDTIDYLKNELTLKKIKYDSLFNKYTNQKDSVFNFKWKYQANRETFTEREKDYWKTEKIHEISKVVMIGIIILQFHTITQLQNKIR